MPVITVHMYEGRTVEQKRALVEAITRAMVEIARSRADQVNVIIQDVPRTNWGLDGKLAADT